LPLAAFFVTAGVMSIPPDTHGVDIVAGRDLFRAHCGSCHFAKEGFPAHHGPNLYQIGRLGGQRRPGLTAPQYILESILEPNAFIAPSSRPGMPSNVVAELPPNDIRNIIGFLASCGAFPDYNQIVQLEIPDRRTDRSAEVQVSRETMEMAAKLLEDKGTCLQCHSVYNVPESRFHAPAIFGVGLTDGNAVRKSIVEPYAEIKPSYRTVQVALTSGEVISGRLISRNDKQVILSVRDEQGQLANRQIAIDDIEQEDDQPVIAPSTLSLMPDGFAKSLTSEELDAVLLLIHQLN
jgi:hypothetical protein